MRAFSRSVKNVKPPDTSRLCRTGRVEALEHLLGTRRKAQSLVVDTLQRLDRQTFQQGDAPGEAPAEVDLAAHRALGEQRDLRLDAEQVGDLVDALDRDQRRVHVHRDDADVGEPPGMGDERAVNVTRSRSVVESLARTRAAQPECGCRGGFDRLDARGLREQCDCTRVRQRSGRALDDEVGALDQHGRGWTSAAHRLARARASPMDAAVASATPMRRRRYDSGLPNSRSSLCGTASAFSTSS